MSNHAKRFAVSMLAVAGLAAGFPPLARAGGNVFGGTGLYLTHSAETLAPGALRLGAFAQYDRYVISEDPEDWDLSPQLAWSPVRNLELMASVPLLRHHVDPERKETGIGDGVLGVKYRLFPHVAALGYLSLPSGDEDRGLGSGGTSAGLAGILSLPLGAGVSADLNVGYQFSGVSGEEGDDFLFYGLGLSVPVGSRTALFGELAGRTVWEGETHDTVQFDLGIRHRLDDRVALTAGAGRGLRGDYGPEDPRTRVFAGVEFLLGVPPAAGGPAAGGVAPAVPAAPPASASAPPPPAPAVPVAVPAPAPAPAAPAAAPAPAPMPAVPAAPVAVASAAPTPAAPAHTAEEIAAAKQRLAAAEVLFEYDRARLTPEGDRSLAQVAADLARYPELRFTIEGHADNRGASSYNRVLGLRRAEAVMRYLVKAGIGFERMKISSGGELRPKVPNRDAKSRALNRRAAFSPLP